MKEKEIEELLDNLKEIIENATIKNNYTQEEFSKRVEEALNEECKIKIENKLDGAHLSIDGGRLSLLLTLAGAEKSILKQLACSEKEFEFIKKIISVEELK